MEIVKGKRTKRPRPCSPANGGASCFPNPSLESEWSDGIAASTEEEKDMANCLILLAQGFCPETKRRDNDDEEERNGSEIGSEKVFDKRVLDEINTDATGRTSLYIYECQTCDRTFPSFQALGGHRASHKKLRIDRSKDKEVKGEDVEGQFSKFITPQQIDVGTINIKASKVHECSICGSEFSSGQALGGHMRRHRAAPPVKASGESEEESPVHKTINILSFDLNLPAPIEDDQNQVMESPSCYRPKNHLVLAAPALVGCHF